MSEHDTLAPLSPRTLLACAALFAACCHVLTCAPRAEEIPPSLASRLEEPPPDAWVPDSAPDAGTDYTRGLPPEPFPDQRRASKDGKCGPRQVPIRATPTSKEVGCWKRLADPPGRDQCGEDFLHNGECYAPVKQGQRAPTAIED